MNRIIEFLSTPGAKGAIQEAAPTQQAPSSDTEPARKEVNDSTGPLVQNITGFVAERKKRRLDRWLDHVVQASGSEPTFFFILTCLLAWAFLGIPFGNSVDWAAIISDVQAIVSYIFDSFLMRQQLNEYERILRVSACLVSRSLSHQRMLRQTMASGQYPAITPTDLASLTGYEAKLLAENWLGRISTIVSQVLGHIITICLFWVCIAIWLGFGPYNDWSDRWQLYINSATSALMILVFAFLANIRERHNKYTRDCLQSLFSVDSEVELKLRILTGDTTPNPTVVIPAPNMSKLQRAIFYYADVVGTLIGIGILIIVMAIWVAIGPRMSFDSNWWLLIGTYAGLVGLNDGYVLRNVQFQLSKYEDSAFQDANMHDIGIFDEIHLPDPAADRVQDSSINHRISARMGVVCSHEITVALGFFLIVGLLIGASIMKWTTTGQLLCNIPPSIIESFFMMILITGHNLNEFRQRGDLQNMYLRRVKLLAYVDRLAANRNPAVTPNEDIRHEPVGQSIQPTH